jgi:hypothetical protein
MSKEILPGEVTPTLFVGLGGSGGRAVRRIAKHLRARADFGVRYEGLVRFLAIDTNEADLARLRTAPGAIQSTVAISDFDKVEYSALRRGESFADADPYFTQWVHPWYRFREESGAGAGQIRIESRLGFNRAVEVGTLSARLSEIIDALRHHGEGMRKSDAAVQVFVYFSIAGGTGSGGFLPFSYLVRDALGDKRARLFGFAILPEAFEVVAGRNRDGVYANGYAALKELEHLMKLDTSTSGSPTEIPFHYDPRNKSRTKVVRRPFDLVYVVDRPAHFSVDEVGEALADASYIQIFSPILGDQQGDYDNYTKESRALFPSELGGDGYTAFYGTLGASLMLLPRRDLLAYCARRYAASAVRRYLLLDDPRLVSEQQREQFKRFALDPDELATLAPDERGRRIDQAFVARIDMLAEGDREGGTWKRVHKVRETTSAKLTALLSEWEQRARGKTTAIREISADRILDGSWTPASTIGGLSRELEKARADVDSELRAIRSRIEGGDFWTDFLKSAGPDGAPELSPYEQRVVLVGLREPTGLLGSPAIDELVRQIGALDKEADLSREGRFVSEMEACAAQLKKTFRGLDVLLPPFKDKDFEEARERTVAAFNDQVAKLRALLVKRAMQEIRTALGKSTDALRGDFRNIEASAGRLAVELEEKARRFEFDGGSLDGGGPRGGHSLGEANDYALDVEILQHPSGRARFWHLFYADQIATRPETSDQKAMLDALSSALRPRFDDRGKAIARTAREIVGDVERSLIEVAEDALTTSILGDPKSEDPSVRAGLTMDAALALEARYYAAWTEQELAVHDRKKKSAEESIASVAPLFPSKLWSEDTTRVYATKKLKSAIAKAQPLTRFSPESKSVLKHADMLLVGVHPVLGKSPLGSLLDASTEGLSASAIGDWPDPDRLVFYRSVLGVPLYCFPHVNEEMKACYRRFQAQPEKAWPLHIDHHWEGLPDLDPEDRRAEIAEQKKSDRVGVGALALGIARGTIERGADGFVLKVSGASLPLGTSPLGAARALSALEREKPAVHQLAVEPLENAASHLDAAARAELGGTLKIWSERAVALELESRRDAGEEREYDELRQATSILKALTSA